MKPKSIVSPGQFLVVCVGDESYQLTKDNKNFSKVESLIKRQKWDEVFSILGAAKNIKVFSEGNVKIEGDTVYYKNQVVDNYVGEKLISMIQEGASDFHPLARFLDKVMQSQFTHVKEHLYRFLEYGGLPITEDGDFLGYKSVRDDYLDVHSGKYDNSPGSIVKMPREGVVSDPHQACSSGLHVGVKQYVDGFGGSRTVIVKVDPRNVISVPYDYGHQKMRTCEYYVVADYDPSKPLTSEVYQVTEEQQAKATKKAAKVVKYVSPNTKPLRDKYGRFIKKNSPLRGPDGKFVKKNKPVEVNPNPNYQLDNDRNYDEDEYESDGYGDSW